MIINIRGTSGSGKSYIVREVMRRVHGAKFAIKVPGRRQPLLYRFGFSAPRGAPPHTYLSIIGHYETACGGCDTIHSLDRIYELVREEHGCGNHVLYEGLLLSAEVNRPVALHDAGYPLLVIGLDVPLQECIDSINARRRAKDPDKPPVNPKNTEAKWKQTRRAMQRLEEAGVRTEWHGRAGALVRVLGELGL